MGRPHNPIKQCPSCGAATLESFYEVRSVPTNSCILLTSRAAAKEYPRGDIRLGFCPSCGFISNTAFEQALTEYDGQYEESQEYSPTYNTFHKRLAQRLIARYGLTGKEVIEIGCGQGEFLDLLCSLGVKHGLGFDPAYTLDRSRSRERVKVISDFYSDKYAEHQADFVCCKMTLEHIPAPDDFIGMVQRSIGKNADTVVFFQIPEATRILRDCAFADIYYEHCSYFSPGSLGRLFRRHGFEVIDITTDYDDQYLAIEAKPAGRASQKTLPIEHDLERLKHYVAAFPGKFKDKQTTWHRQLKAMASEKCKVVLWGSGSKATSFLTTFDTGDAIRYVVDINPIRQGTYVAGTGHEIIAPSLLRDFKPDVVILMNRIYREEVSAELGAMGLTPQIIAL